MTRSVGQGLSVDPLKEENFSSEILSKKLLAFTWASIQVSATFFFRIEALEEELLTMKLKHAQEKQLQEWWDVHYDFMD